MSQTRDNHYVPQWYQRQFIEPGGNKLAYLDKEPLRRTLQDGRTIVGRSVFDAPTSRCFFQTDLYSTFFGSSVNDEIERRLFGDMDARGSEAVRAFVGMDESAWHQHFQTLFEYINIQKIRTPKGLDWLRAQYPALSQNELMREMQGIRNLHCTIWTEGVREIVSAEDADVKFLISDHPVTIYNHALPQGAPACAYPNDPSIALKASQTVFPLSRDFCLILTNLEYAKNPACPPLEKRTFARNFRNSMVSTVDFIRTRKLASAEVAQINHILKTRAHRYVAAGREEWLYPETQVKAPWAKLRKTLLPPDNELWRFGGEIFAEFDDGRVYYQDEFGRTDPAHEFLLKPPFDRPLKPNEACGCGSARPYRICCSGRPVALRPSWNELSIRERNLALHRGVMDILGFNDGEDWGAVRMSLTREQIRRVYALYRALWPLETDLLKLLPKPDGRPRAVYTGSIHPETFNEFAAGAALYFGELIVEHPFIHAGTVAERFNPIEHPERYHLEFIKSVVFFVNIMPMVDVGMVNLVPNPCTFDTHLRDQMMHMAQERYTGLVPDISQEPRLEQLARTELRRHIMMWPREALIAHLREDLPDLDEEGIESMLQSIAKFREADPLVALVDGIFEGGKEGGQLQLTNLVPNFEIAMYLAQATGAAIVTDSTFRWREMRAALRPRFSPAVANLRALAGAVSSREFLFPNDSIELAKLYLEGGLSAYPALMRDAFQYLARLPKNGVKPNWETHAKARFEREHGAAQTMLSKRGLAGVAGKISCAFPANGIQDNTVNRLLLMSSSEHHLPSVPMAFFIEPATSNAPSGNAILAKAAG
ncbi:MAG: DUF4238 domain-containing protein [Novosphingobium sp.]|nr:DUF4238 domain-containing protein [Novosphingobium sp.]